MDHVEIAHRELDRLQSVITRHEGHLFALRGWLLAIIGGLLTAYYTENIDLTLPTLRLALICVALIFLLLESRHVNLIEAVVERASDVERQIRSMLHGPRGEEGYDGPRLGEACGHGASRVIPRSGMTLVLNLPFYIAVVLVVMTLTAVSLPAKHQSGHPAPSTAEKTATTSSVKTVTQPGHSAPL